MAYTFLKVLFTGRDVLACEHRNLLERFYLQEWDGDVHQLHWVIRVQAWLKLYIGMGGGGGAGWGGVKSTTKTRSCNAEIIISTVRF